jgi:hypothetical protein
MSSSSSAHHSRVHSTTTTAGTKQLSGSTSVKLSKTSHRRALSSNVPHVSNIFNVPNLVQEQEQVEQKSNFQFQAAATGGAFNLGNQTQGKKISKVMSSNQLSIDSNTKESKNSKSKSLFSFLSNKKSVDVQEISSKKNKDSTLFVRNAFESNILEEDYDIANSSKSKTFKSLLKANRSSIAPSPSSSKILKK